jgi:predicted NAD/FAD-binding protein
MFDNPNISRKKIAVIGAGISGLSSAYYLSKHHDVTLFEAESRLGGHARTKVAGINGDQPVDTGFIVFNFATYPYLTRLFNELDVPIKKSDMSFAATIDNGHLEYAMNGIGSLVAQKRNLIRPQFYKMIRDIFRFGSRAEDVASDDKSIGEFIDELRLGKWFKEYYMLPMCGAIWSTPLADIDKFPSKSLVQFFRNHGLLAGGQTHEWWTVDGGSREYVSRIEAALLKNGTTIQLGAPVLGVTRRPLDSSVHISGHSFDGFDEIIFATHSDQALRILGSDATKDEKTALGSVQYQENRAVLHRDVRQMPQRRACWSSWVYRSQQGSIGVTYWMNLLQGIPESDPLFVTLNPTDDIPDELIYDDVQFAHPVFDAAAIRAQTMIKNMQGANRTWFAGAYNRHGFHEDGIASAMRVIRAMNAPELLKGDRHEIHGQRAEVSVPISV